MKPWIARSLSLTFIGVTLACALMYVRAQERLVLNAPVLAVPGANTFLPYELIYRRSHPDWPTIALVRLTVREADAMGFVPMGRTLVCQYSDLDAEVMIATVNRAAANMKVSLERFIMQRCQMDGKLGAGSISGTP